METLTRLCLPLPGLIVLAAGPLFSADQAGSKEFEMPVKWEFRLRSEIRDDFDFNASRTDDNRPFLQRFRLSVAPRWRSL